MRDFLIANELFEYSRHMPFVEKFDKYLEVLTK